MENHLEKPMANYGQITNTQFQMAHPVIWSDTNLDIFLLKYLIIYR